MFEVYNNQFKSDDQTFDATNEGLIIITILFFMINYSLTIGTTTWVYLTETMPPRALGLAMFARWFLNGTLTLVSWTIAHITGVANTNKSYDKTISLNFFIYSGASI